jgi:hypothetical protein
LRKTALFGCAALRFTGHFHTVCSSPFFCVTAGIICGKSGRSKNANNENQQNFFYHSLSLFEAFILDTIIVIFLIHLSRFCKMVFTLTDQVIIFKALTSYPKGDDHEK